MSVNVRKWSGVLLITHDRNVAAIANTNIELDDSATLENS